MTDQPPPPSQPPPPPSSAASSLGGAEDGNERPFWKKKRFIIPAVIVLLLAFFGALGDTEDDAETVAGPETTSEETTAAPEVTNADETTTTEETTTIAPTTTTTVATTTTAPPPTPQEALLGAVQHEVRPEYLPADASRPAEEIRLEGRPEGQVLRVVARYDPAGDCTADSVRAQTAAVLQVAQEAPDIRLAGLHFTGSLPLQDQLGRVSEETVFDGFYGAETLYAIDHNHFNYRLVFDVADSADVHPLLFMSEAEKNEPQSVGGAIADLFTGCD